MSRRAVRSTPEFVDRLYRVLPAERKGGLPSVMDFMAYTYSDILDRFADGWDSLPEHIAGRSQYRELITTSYLGLFVAVVGQLASDGAIELIDIDIEAPFQENDE